MKIMKVITLTLLLIGVTFMMGCDKKATQSELNDQKPQATVFSLSFSPTVYKNSYSGIKGYSKGDVLLVYGWSEIEGKDAWGALPGTVFHSDSQTGWVIRTFKFEEDSGKLYIYTYNADGTSGSPWTKDMLFKYKAVVIKSSAIQQNPDVDLSNYAEVKARFDVVE